MKNRKKILILDDEEDFLEMVKLNLEKVGRYRVAIETNPKHALGIAKAFKPDLIFLDIMMPGMDGADVASQLKNDAELADIPVVFLTAIVKEEEIDSKGGNIAGHLFLPKPVSIQKLVECIEANLKK